MNCIIKKTKRGHTVTFKGMDKSTISSLKSALEKSSQGGCLPSGDMLVMLQGAIHNSNDDDLTKA